MRKRPVSIYVDIQPYDDLFSAAILASIFRLAASIISSLLCCINDCLSVLFWLQPCFPADDSPSVFLFSLLEANFAPRLYRVIRSGWDGFGVPVLVLAPVCEEEDAAGSGMGGWKVCGGCTELVFGSEAICNSRPC
jgi:hypothetical protein